MPTGYTAPVVDGRVTDFAEFAMQCARGMGACITLRDEPANAPIPDSFAPSTYNAQRFDDARTRLAWLRSLTPEQAQTEAEKAHAEALARHEEYEARDRLDNERLDRMLSHVLAWEPPTADHVRFKDFMIQQLEISKNTYRREPPTNRSWQEWLDAEIEKAVHDIGYHAEEQAKEEERARGRTEWVRALRASLSPKAETMTAQKPAE